MGISTLYERPGVGVGAAAHTCETSCQFRGAHAAQADLVAIVHECQLHRSWTPGQTLRGGKTNIAELPALYERRLYTQVSLLIIRGLRHTP